MKIVAISDTHNQHRQVNVPPGDVLLHAGDITYTGEIPVLKDFVQWLCEMPHKHKIFILGNHELTIEDDPSLIDKIFKTPEAKENNVHFLHDSQIIIDGLKVWGSPYSSWFHDWAWNLPEHDAKYGYPGAQKKWNQISYDTNLLLIHGPAQGILDKCDNGNVGCPVLRKRIDQLKKLKAMVTGHIHQAAGTTNINGVQFINGATCTEQYKPLNPPIVFDVNV